MPNPGLIRFRVDLQIVKAGEGQGGVGNEQKILTKDCFSHNRGALILITKRTGGHEIGPLF